MEEKNAVDELIEYLRRNGLEYETHLENSRFYLFSGDPLLSIKYVISQIGPHIFLAYDSYAAKSGMSNTFTGIYSELRNAGDDEYKIYIKDWADSIFRFHKIKTGLKYIDNYLTITSKSPWNKNLKLNEHSVCLFREINKKIYPVSIIIQNDYVPRIKQLKEKKVIGLETNQWIYKKDELDLLLNSGGELIGNMLK